MLVTDVGGLSVQVNGGKTGLVVPPADSRAIAEAILRYFDEGLEADMLRAIEEATGGKSWEGLARTLRELTAEARS